MKTKALWTFTLTMCFALVGAIASADEDADRGPILVCEIAYQFVGHQERLDDGGRLLVWEGKIAGDLNGQMRWWFRQPTPVSGSAYAGGRVNFYAAHWEIWDGDDLLLAGESAGKTVFPVTGDGMWDGHGVVTETSEEFSSLSGRKIYETGPVVLGQNPPVSFSGAGMFHIY